MVCLSVTQLAELLSSAAPPQLASSIDAHVDTCGPCRELLLNLARALSVSPSTLPPPGLQTQTQTQTQLAEARPPPTPSLQALGRRYDILAQIGQGGMGRVFRAYDRLTQTEVALKQVLWPTLPSSSQRLGEPIRLARSIAAASQLMSPATSPTYAPPPPSDTARPASVNPALGRWALLAEEFRTLATLRHPHVVSVLDYGFDACGQPFYTMELLRSAQPIVQWAAARSLSEKAELLLQLLDALAYLHRRGILHRDLSANNVLIVSADGEAVVKVVDFGLAREAEHEGDLVAVGTL